MAAKNIPDQIKETRLNQWRHPKLCIGHCIGLKCVGSLWKSVERWTQSSYEQVVKQRAPA